jgi:hypothetical protein
VEPEGARRQEAALGVALTAVQVDDHVEGLLRRFGTPAPASVCLNHELPPDASRFDFTTSGANAPWLWLATC